MLKYIAGFGATLIACAFVAAAFLALQQTCSSEGPLVESKSHAEPDRPNQNSKSTDSGEKNTSPQNGQPKPTATFDLRVTARNKIEGSYYAKDGDREKGGWTHKFICEAKIGEFALAVFTLLLVIFTAGLWLSTYNLAKIGLREIALAREEFLSSHIPQLRLKHIWFATDDGQDFFGRIEAGRRIVARLDVVNVGSATAIIRVINFVTLIIPLGERLPQRPPYNNEAPANLPGRVELPGFPLNPGITLTQHVSDNRVLTGEEAQRIRNGDARLYFVGTIEYWTVREAAETSPPRLRGTAFCRYLKFHSRPAHPEDGGRFEKDCDPDYEYQD